MSFDHIEHYYNSCDCGDDDGDICECTIITPSQVSIEEPVESPFPDYITNYILTRKPDIYLRNVIDPEEDEFNGEYPYSTLTTHDDQAREITIDPTCSVFYEKAVAYINYVYGCEPDMDIECVCWESQVDVHA